MQDELLTQYPSDTIRVYVIWLPMLGGDARETWDGNIITDTRVTHYWDGKRKVGKWFAEQVDGNERISWDSYYLYGPDAVWDNTPSPLVGSGRTIYGKRETLEMQMRTLLGK